MWLALRSVKSNNVDFLNQIRYFSCLKKTKKMGKQKISLITVLSKHSCPMQKKSRFLIMVTFSTCELGFVTYLLLRAGIPTIGTIQTPQGTSASWWRLMRSLHFQRILSTKRFISYRGFDSTDVKEFVGWRGRMHSDSRNHVIDMGHSCPDDPQVLAYKQFNVIMFLKNRHINNQEIK